MPEHSINTPLTEKPDPTLNVQALNEAANKRQDDLREAERRYNDLRSSHATEIAKLRAEHQKEMAAKESSRIDSIRQIDREEAKGRAAELQQAVATLAQSTTDQKETLQAQQAVKDSEVNKRLSNLELAGSDRSGKSAGLSAAWLITISAVSLIGGLILIASVVIAIAFAIKN